MSQHDIIRYFYLKFCECDFEHYSIRNVSRDLGITYKQAHRQITALQKVNLLVTKKRKAYVDGILYCDYGRIYRLNPSALAKCKRMFKSEEKSQKVSDVSEHS